MENVNQPKGLYIANKILRVLGVSSLLWGTPGCAAVIARNSAAEIEVNDPDAKCDVDGPTFTCEKPDIGVMTCYFGSQRMKCKSVIFGEEEANKIREDLREKGIKCTGETVIILNSLGSNSFEREIRDVSHVISC